MLIKLEKINPEFRQLVDLFLFSNRIDLDLSKFKDLLKCNQIHHYEYFIFQFIKSLDIFWENYDEIWNFRLKSIFSWEEESISYRVASIIEKRMLSLLINKKSPNPKYDIEFGQFLSYCKNYPNPANIKNMLAGLVCKVNSEKLINIINQTVPFLFKDLNEFAKILLNQDISLHHYVVLRLLESKGIRYNKKPLVKLIKSIVNSDNHNRNIYYMVLNIINDFEIRELLKNNQNQKFKKNMLKFIRGLDVLSFDKKCKDINNIIDICPMLADEIGIIYIDQVFSRSSYHKQAKSNLIANLLKRVPSISKKKILSYLSLRGKHIEINYLLSVFSELEGLSAFL